MLSVWGYLEADAETSTGPEFGAQINNGGEEIPAHLLHSGCPSLATTGSFPHGLQCYDDNIQSPKRFRTSVLIRMPAPGQICP